jgi:hypothetical protein
VIQYLSFSVEIVDKIPKLNIYQVYQKPHLLSTRAALSRIAQRQTCSPAKNTPINHGQQQRHGWRRTRRRSPRTPAASPPGAGRPEHAGQGVDAGQFPPRGHAPGLRGGPPGGVRGRLLLRRERRDDPGPSSRSAPPPASSSTSPTASGREGVLRLRHAEGRGACRCSGIRTGLGVEVPREDRYGSPSSTSCTRSCRCLSSRPSRSPTTGSPGASSRDTERRWTR